MALIRFPGAKAKLFEAIAHEMPDEYVMPLFTSPHLHYVEPFFGSGAIGLEVMRRLDHDAAVTLSDADVGVAMLWRSVWKHPRELIERVMRFVPTVDAFYEFKAADGTYTDDVDTGFRKLALHRISVSGFGAMAGGPIGGREQKGDYKVGCRWRPNKIRLEIKQLHKRFKLFPRLRIQCRDVFDVLDDAASEQGEHDHTFAYLDPPYYEKGDMLYAIKFTPTQHERLAGVLMGANYLWAVSYDDHTEIRRLYAGALMSRLEITYCNAVCRGPVRRKNHEILILPQRQIAAAG